MTKGAGQAFEAVYDAGETGLAGTVAVRIDDNEGNTVVPATTAGIIELGTSGVYSVELTAPNTLGTYTILWSSDGTFDADTGGVERLEVISADAVTPLPPLSSDGSGGLCSAWTTPALVAACCEGLEDLDDPRLETVIQAASEILYGLSGELYPGECETTIRPCPGSCSCWTFIRDSGYYWYGLAGYWRAGGRYVGCAPVSEVVLPGAPIREIVEVKIDGTVIDPSGYQLYMPNRLLRMRDPAEPGTRRVWPGCQIIDLEDTEPGTFSITYGFGASPPASGIDAASALACELWKACSGQECALPQGTTEVLRQGIRIQVGALAAALKVGATGILAIDAFLSRHGGDRQEVSTVWSPDIGYPERPGPAGGS